MARQDGRVEKGQSIRSAFSAKAWNRAQDAADIVLGVQPGIEAGVFAYPQPYVSANVKIAAATTSYPHGGVAVKITGAQWPMPVNSNQSTQWPRPAAATALDYLNGEIAAPRSLLLQETQSTVLPEMFGVTVEPIAVGQTVVRCAVAGVCVAAIRDISFTHRYAALPTLRSSSDSAAASTGLLETSDCGYAVILARVSGWAIIKL